MAAEANDRGGSAMSALAEVLHKERRRGADAEQRARRLEMQVKQLLALPAHEEEPAQRG